MRQPMIPVSVIVPNYNSGVYLSESIESINSGLWPAEILIIDDCSTDSSPELAEKLKAKFSNIRLLSLKVNGGAAEARKLGISEATHDLIALVDADDLLEPDALGGAYAAIMSSGADICIWELWRFDEQTKWRHDANPTDFPKTGVEAVLLTLGGWRIHAAGVARKFLYEKAYQGFAEKAFNADELLTRLVFSHAAQVVQCNKKYYYRSHASSTTRVLDARRLSSLRSHLWVLNFALRFPGAPITEMVCGAIGEAWFFWTQRKRIGTVATFNELRSFLSGIYSTTGLWRMLLKNPKHLVALLLLSTAVWVQEKVIQNIGIRHD